MNSLLKSARSLLLAGAACLAATAVNAQATRTWVSGVGDDANPCSRTAPCKTFAGAISKTATGGEISTLDPGGYGAVTITKSITISGDGTLSSILSAGTNGINVNAPVGSVIIIRNVSIHGAGTGINGVNVIGIGVEVHLDRVTITGVTGQGVMFTPSSGIGTLFMSDTYISNATGGAVYVQPSGSAIARASLNGVTMNGNGRGLRAEDRSTVIVRNSFSTGNDNNGFVGLAVGAGTVDMTLENCVSSNNGATGIYAGSGTTVRLSNVTATRNADGLLAVGGGTIISFGNNRLLGNINSNNAPNSNVGQM